MRIREIAANSALVMLGACPIVLTGLALRRAIISERMADPPAVQQVTNWQQIAAVGNKMGRGDGSITVVEFSDFQCPYCAQVQSTLHELRSKYPTRVRVIYRHLPLSEIHHQAFSAAQAAECASEQGAFERYHDVLFQEQKALAQESWMHFAKQAGVPRIEEFTRCLHERRYANRVQRDVGVARALGIHSTPTLIINGRVVKGNASLQELERDLREQERVRSGWLGWFGH